MFTQEEVDAIVRRRVARERLEHAARTCDELAALQEALADSAAMTTGSMGQPRVHPLFAEVRQHRDTLRRLLGSLEVADAPAVTEAVSLGAMSNAEASARRPWRSHRIEQAARKGAG